jgi:hypothetical protein
MVVLSACSKDDIVTDDETKLSSSEEHAGTTKSTASYGEVTRSGSTFTAKVNGSTVYSGSDYMDAIQAAADNLTSGRTTKETVLIKNSGSTGSYTYEDDLKVINIPSYTILDFNNTTFNVNDESGDDDIVPVRGRYAEHIEIKNMNITGNPRYGIKIEGCNDVLLSNITINIPDATTIGEGIRIEYRSSTWSTNIVLEDINVSNCIHHGVETYGVDGFTFGSIVTSNTGGCGLLLNNSTNGTVESVDAYRACYGGGYAACRFANNCGPNITVDYVKARECGRGVFGVSGSNGFTVNYVDISGSTSHGILLENVQNCYINDGVISNCGSEGVRITSRSDGVYTAAQYNTVQSLVISGCPYGIRETLPYTNHNYILNNNLSDNDTPLYYEGDGTVASGNTL